MQHFPWKMFPLEFLGCFFISLSTVRGKKGPKTDTFDVSMLKRGDLLEVPRTLFTHYGIYLGDDRVSHLIPDILPAISANHTAIEKMVTNQRLLLGVIAKRASIRVDTVGDFAYGAEVLVNRMDAVYSMSPMDGEEVASRAERLLGPVNYSLLWYNCEHYVMYCRYGTSISFQTSQFCKTVRKIVLSKRSSFLSLLLCLFITLHLGCVSVYGLLATVLIPFTIWMAS
ncbi:lecithin retinol acyltransferase b, tandem duplicate 2 [Brachyhypopomus gauderio]|uniref:lecithin retinol acyltransferase b, tandem duplicate 2 n=1 Tax=Brachyhypopomus gauderio TaxID=698409 RepID=UPI00404178DA